MPDAKSFGRLSNYASQTGNVEVWIGCNIALGITFYFIYHNRLPLSRGLTIRTSPPPPPANSNDHLRRLHQRHHHLLVLPPPLTHSISLALSAAITGQLARSIYLPTYGGAPRLGLIGNGPIFGISAHSLRDPPPRGSPLLAHGLQPLERGVQPDLREWRLVSRHSG